MNCLCCGKKMQKINQDVDYSKWERKYHKKCWSERNMYYNLYLKIQKFENWNPKTLEFYKIKSCLI